MYFYIFIILFLLCFKVILANNFNINPINVIDYKSNNNYWQGFTYIAPVKFANSLTEQIFYNSSYNQPYIFTNKGSVGSYSAIIIDGVKIIDPSNTKLFVDIGQLNANLFESIEIVDNNVTTIYGSGASMGALILSTKKFNKNYSQLNYILGYPNFSKFSILQNFNNNNFNIMFLAAGNNSNQFSLAKYNAELNKATEKDKTKVLDLATKINYVFNNTFIDILYYHNASEINFDAYDYINNIGFMPIDNNIEMVNKINNLGYVIIKSYYYNYNYSISALSNTLKRNYTSIYGNNNFMAKQHSVTIDNNFIFNSFNVNVGINTLLQSSLNNNLNYLDTYINNYYTYNNSTFYYGYRYNILLGSHNITNNANSIGANLSVLDNYKVFINLASGYRNPSIFEIDNADKSLVSETSKTIDLGIDYKDLNVQVNNKIFMAKTNNLISYNSIDYKYYNTNNFIINRGLINSININFNKYSISWQYNYYLHNVNNNPSNGSIVISNYYNNITNSITAIFVNSKLDCIDNICNNLASYVVFNYKLQYDINNYKYKYSTYAQVNNILNKNYSSSYKYNSAPLSIYMGIQIST